MLEKIEFHFRLASSASVSEKLIFNKSRFGYLQVHLEHAAAYLLLIFLIITVVWKLHTICHDLSKGRRGKRALGRLEKVSTENCSSLT